MSAEIDPHAAWSLWMSRATLVSEFEPGGWRVVTLRAYPDDVESPLGRLACAVSTRGSFRGLVSAREQRPQLHGRIPSAGGWTTVESEEFTGGTAELEEAVKRELLRGPGP